MIHVEVGAAVFAIPCMREEEERDEEEEEEDAWL